MANKIKCARLLGAKGSAKRCSGRSQGSPVEDSGGPRKRQKRIWEAAVRNNGGVMCEIACPAHHQRTIFASCVALWCTIGLNLPVIQQPVIVHLVLTVIVCGGVLRNTPTAANVNQISIPAESDRIEIRLTFVFGRVGANLCTKCSLNGL